MSTDPLSKPAPDMPVPVEGQGQPQYQAPPSYVPVQGQPMYVAPMGQPMGQPMYAQPMYQGAPQPGYYPPPGQYYGAVGQPPMQAQPVYATPVQGQPMYTQQQNVMIAVPYGQQMIPLTGEWKTDFCDMCNDMEICCTTLWCPCVQYGYNQEMLDNSDCGTHCCIWFALAWCVGMPCIAHFMQREKLRRRFGLREDCGPDLFATCCCAACAICQEARELKIRQQEALAGPPGQIMA